MYFNMIANFVYISLFFALAVILKKYIPILRRFIIPNSIVAGFFGLLLGPNVLNVIPLDFDSLGRVIYHLMAIGFISLALRNIKRNSKINAVNAGFIIVSTYLFQGIIGFSLMLLWNEIDPNVSPLIGMLLPLGYGQGPGQAYSIGTQWEKLGLQSGGEIGLAIAASGFVWATIGGIIVLNLLLRRSEKKEIRVKSIYKKPIEVKDYEFADMDGMTIQLVIVGTIYLITYILLKVLAMGLIGFGNFGYTFATVLWGFHFVFGALIALGFRNMYIKLHEKGIAKENYLNNFLLQRIAGAVFDFMVAASISAVSFKKVSTNFWPIFVLTFLGGFLTYLYLSLVIKKTVKKYISENIIAFFGMLTGTISTGMALLRELDPGFEKGVAENLVFGSGVSIFIGLPLIAVLNIPALALTTGNYSYYLYTFLGIGIYAVPLYFIWFRQRK